MCFYGNATLQSIQQCTFIWVGTSRLWQTTNILLEPEGSLFCLQLINSVKSKSWLNVKTDLSWLWFFAVNSIILNNEKKKRNINWRKLNPHHTKKKTHKERPKTHYLTWTNKWCVYIFSFHHIRGKYAHTL